MRDSVQVNGPGVIYLLQMGALRFRGGPTPGRVQAEGRKPAVRRVPEHPEGTSRAVHGSCSGPRQLQAILGQLQASLCDLPAVTVPPTHPPRPHPRGISRLMGVLKSSRGGRGYLQAYTELRSRKHTCCLDAGKEHGLVCAGQRFLGLVACRWTSPAPPPPPLPVREEGSLLQARILSTSTASQASGSSFSSTPGLVGIQGHLRTVPLWQVPCGAHWTCLVTPPRHPMSCPLVMSQYARLPSARIPPPA